MTMKEDLNLQIETLRERIREQKKRSGMTIDQVAEAAGVSKSVAIKFLSNSKLDPRLHDSVAFCKFFGVSLDESFGLETPQEPAGVPQDILERSHRLEVENARLSATNAAQRSQIRSAHSICYMLVFFCILLALSLVVYLVIDSQITDAGIIRGGKLSAAAWLFIGLIVASIIAAGAAILRIVRREDKEEPPCSNA